jgi:hypothetical protein
MVNVFAVERNRLQTQSGFPFVWRRKEKRKLKYIRRNKSEIEKEKRQEEGRYKTKDKRRKIETKGNTKKH